MQPAISIKPLIVARGATWSIPVEYTDPNGAAVDVSGWTLTGKIEWSGTKVELTVANGGVILTDAVNGKWKYLVGKNDAVQAQIPSGQAARFVIWVVDSLGNDVPLAVVPLKVLDL